MEFSILKPEGFKSLKTGTVFMIETFDLTKEYGTIKAVNALSLKIKKGEIFGLLGPNGAGKTTAISMLSTVLKPTSGTAKVSGFDIVKQQEKVRKSIGIVFQAPSVDDLLTGKENLEMHALLFEIPKSERKERIEEVLKLARGMMHHPTILFLDEPTLGLDPRASLEIHQGACGTVLLHNSQSPYTLALFAS